MATSINSSEVRFLKFIMAWFELVDYNIYLFLPEYEASDSYVKFAHTFSCEAHLSQFKVFVGKQIAQMCLKVCSFSLCSFKKS